MNLECNAGQAGFRADRALCALLPQLNRRGAKTLFRDRLIRLNGKIASGAERVHAGDRFHLPDAGTNAAENPIAKAAAPRLTTPHGRHLTRLYEDADILVISKPAEIPVHRGQGGFTRRDTLEEVMARAYPPQTGVVLGNTTKPPEPGFYFVHRLDMETSGCLLIAKNAAARDALIRDFSARKIHKEYLAIIAGAASWDETVSHQPIKYVRGEKERLPRSRPPPETESARQPFYSLMRKQRSKERGLAPKLGQKKGVALEEGDPEGKICETHFETLERFRGFSLLRVQPKTGRTHQIRVHLVALGHALAYDPMYGRKTPLRMREFEPALGESEGGDEIVLNRLPLHAWKLSFKHPATGQRISIEAPLPRDLKEFIRILRNFRAR